MKSFRVWMAILFLGLPVCVSAQNKRFEIKGHAFITRQVVQANEWNSKDTLLYLYRMENGKEKYLLKHYTYKDEGGDCNNLFWNIGTYQVAGDSLVFLTRHLQKTGIDPIPEWEKQVYQVSSDGRLTLVLKEFKMTGDSIWKKAG